MGLKFNDIDLKTNYNFVVIEVQGRGSPPVSRTTLDHPLVHGDIELNSKLRSRDIIIRGYVYGSDLSTKKDNLIKLITQAYEKECKITFPDTNRSVYVKLAGEPIVVGPVGPSLNAQAYELSFKFIAQDPFFYGETIEKQLFQAMPIEFFAPEYLLTPRRDFLKREKDIYICAYTVVNLLGSDATFATDSNGDGIPDGWEIRWGTLKSASREAFGGTAVEFETTSTSNVFVGLGRSVTYTEGTSYFATVAITDSHIGTGTISYVVFYSWPGVNVFGTNAVTDDVNRTKLSYTAFTSPRTINDYFTIRADFHSSDGSLQTVRYSFSMPTFVNLTEMGSLPTPLKEYFNNTVINWEELATDANITSIDGQTKSGRDWLATLIPPFYGVKTFGYAWR